MELARFTITPALRQALEPLIIDSLFEYCVRHRVRTGMSASAPVQLTVAQAMEVLAAQPSRWNDRLREEVVALSLKADTWPRRMGQHFQELLLKTHEYFRREGAMTFRAAVEIPNDGQRFSLLWTDVFSRRVLDWLRENELVADPDHLDIADTLVECAKLWTQELSKLCGPKAGPPVEPSSFFLDADSELTATFERGPIKLRVRGRPEALWLRALDNGLHLHACKAADPDLAALRIVQAVLFMILVEQAQRQPCKEGAVAFIRESSGHAVTEFSPAIDEAFAPFIGNRTAVSKLKTGTAIAIRQSPWRLLDNYLIVGPGGHGKSDLARCVAGAMNLPLIALACGSIKKTADLLAEIDRSLLAADFQPSQSGEEGDKQVSIYPAFVLALEDAHEWRRMASALQPLLDTNERSLFTETAVARFPHISVLMMSAVPAKIPDSFLAACRRVDLEPYRPKEVATMVRGVFAKANLDLPEALALMLARMGRCNPLRALDLARAFRDRHERAKDTFPLTREALLTVAHDDWKLDERGLTANDYQYLQALESGPKGLPALQQLLPISSDLVTAQIEPYLIHLGAVYRSARGRVLTVLGEQLLHRRC